MWFGQGDRTTAPWRGMEVYVAQSIGDNYQYTDSNLYNLDDSGYFERKRAFSSFFEERCKLEMEIITHCYCCKQLDLEHRERIVKQKIITFS